MIRPAQRRRSAVAVRSVDPNLPAANIATMDQLLERTLAQPKFLAALLTGFSTLAALLALVGVYSVLSFSVSRRVREIGVRLALGADRSAVVRLVLKQSLVLVGSGLVARHRCSRRCSRAA